MNGEKVDCIAMPMGKKIVYCNKCEGICSQIYINEEIAKIVTKEQFKSIEYEV